MTAAVTSADEYLHLHLSGWRNILTQAQTTLRSLSTCDISKGSLRRPAPEDGEFVEWVLLHLGILEEFHVPIYEEDGACNDTTVWQDGAHCRSSGTWFNIFLRKWISRGVPIILSTSSSHFTTPDFFFWQYLGQATYVSQLPTILPESAGTKQAAVPAVKPATPRNVLTCVDWTSIQIPARVLTVPSLNRVLTVPSLNIRKLLRVVHKTISHNLP